ncbi:ZrgA family zinc uptake protein [Endozoicomonas acroporae]|uniref:ZrgA family zinc uptake protein n=1 Tax=Endozoicomonas acroporae TaxID=1701104 RepID=UPI0013D3D67B|nr:DUF2796 domain-containing protein [Endozoicomonas acroporae]
MRCVAKVAAVACALITAGVAADGHRHAGAHVHGAGHLNFAIEGRQVHIELETPGFDILGFESIRSDAQRRQLKDALLELEKDDLWSFAPAASCTLQSASASASGEHGEDHHGDADGHHHDKHEHDDHHGDGHHESAHMDIAATYVYECANIAGLNSISTRLFQRFANSEQLQVQGFTDAGQIAGQMNRERPEVRF